MHALLLPICLIMFSFEEDKDLLEYVPSDARLVVSVKDVLKVKKSFMESSAYSFIQDPLVKELMDRNIDNVIQPLGFIDELSPLKFLESYSGSAILYSKALFHMEFNLDALFYIPKPAIGNKLPAPQVNMLAAVSGSLTNINYKCMNFEFNDLTVILEPNKQRDQLNHQLDRIREYFNVHEERYLSSYECYSDVDLDIYDFSFDKTKTGKIVIIETEDLVFITVNKKGDQALKNAYALIDKYQNENEGQSILDHECFIQGRHQIIGEDMNVEFYYDMSMFIDEVLPYKGREYTLWVKSIRTVYMAGEIFSEDGLDLTAKVLMKKSGLLNCAINAPTMDFLKTAPNDAYSIITIKMDLNEIEKYLKTEFNIENSPLFTTYNFDKLSGKMAYVKMEVSSDGTVHSDVPKPYDKSMNGWLIIIEMNTNPIELNQIGEELGDDIQVTIEEFQGNRFHVFSSKLVDEKYYLATSGALIAFSKSPSATRAFLRIHNNDKNTISANYEVVSLCKEQPESFCILLGDIAYVIKEKYVEHNKYIDNKYSAKDNSDAEKASIEKKLNLIRIKENIIYQTVNKHFSGFVGAFFHKVDDGVIIKFKND